MSTSPEKEVLALIPARGGSKSVPRKNLLEMLGRPLIAWSIYHAQKSDHITRVIVSTDDEEIAETARKYGAEVPFIRPDEFARDESPDIDVFIHALEWLRDHERYSPEMVVHLRPTGPARRISLIDQAILKMKENPQADSLRSVSLASQTPFKMWFFRDQSNMEPVVTLPDNPESHSMPRQGLPKAYWQNGYVDIVRPATIIEKRSMVGTAPLGYVIHEEIRDVDYPEDLPLVEQALQDILDHPEAKPDQGTTEERHPV